ncbi:RNA polymerase sporulation sigma factor SigH [Aminipila luticellarii]|uniref:RNA polymerase sigma factor SigS n=1 Tax=Aminipila luticellarii TaxID=2507160 RepID=A0A410PXB1_9FIRM|nr:RNA polymerase sporulation sigma factor SigH [Aminipila luticellarii]QAT43534.1 RNA polymerase sporulation sigma factor SigH [Aminipila luticellarii]
MQENYNQTSDEQLAALAQAGDELAEENLIRKYKGAIKNKSRLYFVTGADAEDVMQEGMIGLFKAIRSYREGRNASFRTYAELCINRQILSAVKQAARMKYSPLNTSISIENKFFDESHEISIADTLYSSLQENPETIIIMREKMEGLESEGKSFFSELESKVLVEFLQGKSYNEIGKLMNKSPKSIDNAVQRIRKKLENHLNRG